MPKIAYSEEEREQIRAALVNTGLKLMARQGFQHTTAGTNPGSPCEYRAKADGQAGLSAHHRGADL